MTYAERIIEYLWTIAPNGASNSQIAQALEIPSQQTVYMVTQDLARRGLIHSEREGRALLFSISDTVSSLERGSSVSAGELANNGSFMRLARSVLGEHYGVVLQPTVIPGIAKRFDFASPDLAVVGHCVALDQSSDINMVAARLALISETVWLLEKSRAEQKFLVFVDAGNLPALWLRRFGNLASEVAFYNINPAGILRRLT